MIYRVLSIIVIWISLLPGFQPNTQNNLQTQDEPQPYTGSFVVYSDETYFGSNIDTLTGELRFRFKQANNHRAVFFDLLVGTEYFTIGAINDRGVFISFIITEDFLAGLTPSQFENDFFSTIYETLTIPSENRIREIVSYWDLQNVKMIFAGPNRNAYHLEIQGDLVEIRKIDGNYLSVAYQYSTDSGINMPSQYSFDTQLQAELAGFNRSKGLNLLNQFSGARQSIVSLFFEPAENKLYITLDNNITQIWMINVDGGTIETFRGFDQYHIGNVPEIGITSNDLRILNFSNEKLMDRVILGAIGILLIILVSNFILIKKTA
ncbi:MAG: hypothetical protein CVU39_20520 [Chloroflexi bacterium HGW-Chloroflexi-10]|nr:MAG: hypothetical protein CVU39_20520 [Chloroflexi bacterium HGW-Chloroflexi-10]